MATPARGGTSLLTERAPRLPRRAAPLAAALEALPGALADALGHAFSERASVRCLGVAPRPRFLAGPIRSRSPDAPCLSGDEEAARSLAAAVFGAPVEGPLADRTAEAVLSRLAEAARSLPFDRAAGDGSVLVADYEASWGKGDEAASARFTLAAAPPRGPDLEEEGVLDAVGLPVEAVIARMTLSLRSLRALRPGTVLNLKEASIDAVGLSVRDSEALLARGEMGRAAGARTVRLTAA